MAGKCGCNGTCSCAATGTDSITRTGTGSVADPFRSTLRRNPAAWNLLQSDGDGVAARGQVIYGPNGTPLNPNPGDPVNLPAPCIRDYDGNVIAPVAGCVQLPTGGLPPAYGCGLEAPGGVLRVKKGGTWPGYALAGGSFNGPDTNGSDIYCGADGKLRGVPQGTSVAVSGTSVLVAPAFIAVPTVYTSAASTAVLIGNPSPARAMTVMIESVAVIDSVGNATGTALLRFMLRVRVNGGAWTNVREVAPSAAGGRSLTQVSGTTPVNVGAAGNASVEVSVTVTKDGTGADPTLVGIVSAVVMLGVSK